MYFNFPIIHHLKKFNCRGTLRFHFYYLSRCILNKWLSFSVLFEHLWFVSCGYNSIGFFQTHIRLLNFKSFVYYLMKVEISTDEQTNINFRSEKQWFHETAFCYSRHNMYLWNYYLFIICTYAFVWIECIEESTFLESKAMYILPRAAIINTFCVRKIEKLFTSNVFLKTSNCRGNSWTNVLCFCSANQNQEVPFLKTWKKSSNLQFLR